MGKKIHKKDTKTEKINKKRDVIDMKEIKANKREDIRRNCSMTSYNLTENNTEYNRSYQKFTTENYNVKCVLAMSSFIKEARNIPQIIKNGFDIHHELFELMQEMMMTEIEITLFSLYMEYLGWEFTGYPPKEHWTFIALTVKGLTSSSFDILVKHYQDKYKDFSKTYQQWKVEIPHNEFSLKEINEQYLILTKPHNSLCPKNNVNYNTVVDLIIKTCQPYELENNKSKKESRRKDNEEDVNDDDENEDLEEDEKSASNRIREDDCDVDDMNNNNDNNFDMMDINGDHQLSYMENINYFDSLIQRDYQQDLLNRNNFDDHPLNHDMNTMNNMNSLNNMNNLNNHHNLNNIHNCFNDFDNFNNFKSNNHNNKKKK